MPRKRSNPKDNWLPGRVYRGKCQYEYRPKEGGCTKLGKIERNAQRQPVENDKTKIDVFAAYAKAKAASAIREDMSWLMDKYMASQQWNKLSKGQKKNDVYRMDRLKPAFGKLLPRRVQSIDVRRYMDALSTASQKKGFKGFAAPNKDHGFLSRMFSWSIEYGYNATNPCEHVRKFEEKPRDRYIEDWEYDLVYEIALKSGCPWIAPMMEFSYLCRMRDSEVRGITEDEHLREEGIFVERGKHSKNEITAWSPRLTQALKDAKKLCNPKAPDRINKRPLFKSRSGGFITEDTRNSAWKRIRKTAMEKGLEIDGVQVLLIETFTFHDIKAKGITDHETKEGGHRSKKMEAVYDRKPSIIKATR